MDKKLKLGIHRIRRAIEVGTFDERDVSILLGAFRWEAAKDSPVKELAHFIAHRAKEWGTIHDYVCRVRDGIRCAVVGKQCTFTVSPVFSVTDLKACLDGCLKAAGTEPLTAEQANWVMTCAISLLQEATFVDKQKKPLGTAELNYTRDKVMLLAVTRIAEADATFGFVALEAPNTFMPHAQQLEWRGFGTPMFARCENGSFTLTAA